MLDFISRLKCLHDQPNEMDVNKLAMTLPVSFGDDYMPLITALDAVGENDLSYEKVKT